MNWRKTFSILGVKVVVDAPPSGDWLRVMLIPQRARVREWLNPRFDGTSPTLVIPITKKGSWHAYWALPL